MATYSEALVQAQKAGASKATGDAHLAQTCLVLSSVHAINPEMVFNGAKSKGLTSRDLVKLKAFELGDLMFVT